MKKIRLNENDIERLVKRILKEEGENVHDDLDIDIADIIGPNGNTNHYYTVDDFISDVMGNQRRQPTSDERIYLTKVFWERNTSEGDDTYGEEESEY